MVVVSAGSAIRYVRVVCERPFATWNRRTRSELLLLELLLLLLTEDTATVAPFWLREALILEDDAMVVESGLV